MPDEHLNGQLFDSLLEAQVFTEDWRIDYNKRTAPTVHTAGSRRSSSLRAGFTDNNSHNSHSESISYRGPVTLPGAFSDPRIEFSRFSTSSSTPTSENDVGRIGG
jgi:hypothetical protein